jgi:hypothetical protein
VAIALLGSATTVTKPFLFRVSKSSARESSTKARYNPACEIHPYKNPTNEESAENA